MPKCATPKELIEEYGPTDVPLGEALREHGFVTSFACPCCGMAYAAVCASLDGWTERAKFACDCDGKVVISPCEECDRTNCINASVGVTVNTSDCPQGGQHTAESVSVETKAVDPDDIDPDMPW